MGLNGLRRNKKSLGVLIVFSFEAKEVKDGQWNLAGLNGPFFARLDLLVRLASPTERASEKYLLDYVNENEV